MSFEEISMVADETRVHRVKVSSAAAKMVKTSLIKRKSRQNKKQHYLKFHYCALWTEKASSQSVNIK